MSTVPTATPVTLDRYELPGNLASLAALASSGQITIRPHELIRTTDGRVYHWTTSALEIVSSPVHHGTVADVAALDGIYLLPSCTRGVHLGDTAYVTAAACEYRVTAGINATATWSSCATFPTIPTTPSEVGADPAGTAAAAVSTHNTATDSHADIRTVIAGKQDSLTISTVGTALLNLSTPTAVKIPRINADASVTLIDMPSNVEEVDADFVSISYNPSTTTSTVGEALLSLATPAAQKIPRINADGSVTLIDVPSGGGAASTLDADSLISQLGPLAWYRSGVGMLRYDGTPAEVGDSVVMWVDQSGHDCHLAQPEVGAAPLCTSGVLDGRTTLHFDGVNDCMLANSFPAINLSDYTVLIVFCQHAGAGADAGVFVLGASGSGEPYGSADAVYGSLGGTGSVWVAGANNGQAAISGAGNTPWGVWTHRTYGTSLSASKSGLVTVAASTSVGTSRPGLLLGAYRINVPVSFAAIDVAEVIVFSAALPDGALGILAAALRRLWGI